tara:strand:+ start:943 stop:1305 length:363 start_codon:yes stop_codon:yes gene_type:complete
MVCQAAMNEFLINLEDKPGAMAECCEVIGEAGINILAGAGIASSTAAVVIVTDDAEGTKGALDSIGVTFTMRPLETAVLHHSPGSLGVFTRSLAENGINLQSLFIMKTDGEDVHIGYSTA